MGSLRRRAHETKMDLFCSPVPQPRFPALAPSFVLPFGNYDAGFGTLPSPLNLTHALASAMNKKSEPYAPDMAPTPPPRLEDALVVDKHVLAAYFARVRSFAGSLQPLHPARLWNKAIFVSAFASPSAPLLMLPLDHVATGARVDTSLLHIVAQVSLPFGYGRCAFLGVSSAPWRSGVA